LILESGEKIGGEKPHSGFGETGAGLEGKVVRDKSDFGEDLDEEENKITRAREISKINFKLLWKYKTQRSIRSVSCSTDGKKVLASSENGFVYFIQKNAQSPWRHQSGSSIVNMDLSSEGKYVVFCGSKNIVELLDCRDEGKSLWKIDMSGKWVNSVAISSNAKIIAVSNNDFQVVFLDRDGHLKQSLDMDKIIKVIDITDSGTKLLGASKESLFLIRKSGSKLLKEFHGKDIQCISISKKGKFIAVGTESGSVYLLDGEGRSLWKKNISTPVYGVSVSDDGRVVSGGMNGTIVLNSSKGEQLWKYHTGESVWDLDISKNGDRIIAGCGLVTGHVYHFIMGQTQES
jgi:WD40 repeat protein